MGFILFFKIGDTFLFAKDKRVKMILGKLTHIFSIFEVIGRTNLFLQIVSRILAGQVNIGLLVNRNEVDLMLFFAERSVEGVL